MGKKNREAGGTGNHVKGAYQERRTELAGQLVSPGGGG